jgi:putative membrane protein
LTTCSSARTLPFSQNHFAKFVCGALAVIIIPSAIGANSPRTWILENVLVAIVIGGLALTYRRLVLSDLSYALLTLYCGLHEAGAHYTYARTPAGEWLKPWFHTPRNDYDRVVHFAFGFLVAYVVRELLVRAVGVRGRWVYRLTILIIAGFAAIYEMLEAWITVLSSPDTGGEFLSTQGDPWDSQKDMFMSSLGSGLMMLIVFSKDMLKPRLIESEKSEVEEVEG